MTKLKSKLREMIIGGVCSVCLYSIVTAIYLTFIYFLPDDKEASRNFTGTLTIITMMPLSVLCAFYAWFLNKKKENPFFKAKRDFFGFLSGFFFINVGFGFAGLFMAQSWVWNIFYEARPYFGLCAFISFLLAFMYLFLEDESGNNR